MSKKKSIKKTLGNRLPENDSLVWKNKYHALFNEIPFSLVEINNDNIIHATESARKLLNIESLSSKIHLSEIIPDINIFHKKIADGQKRITLIAGYNNLIFNHILSFSTDDHIFHIEDSSVDKTWQSITNTSTINQDPFQNIIKSSSLGLCIINEKGIIVEWNQAMSDIFKVDREVYMNKPIWEFEYDFLPARHKNPADKKRIKNFVINYLNKPEKTILNIDFERNINNTTKYIQYWLFPIQTQSGMFFGRISIDISEKKASEIELLEYKDHLEKLFEKRTLELKQNEARLRLLLQSIPMAYYTYDFNNRKNIWYSEQIQSLSGFKTEDFKKNPNLWVDRINQDDYKIVGGSFNKLKNDNQRISCEYRWKDANDQEIWILDQAVLIKATDKHPRQIIGCFMDITDRKEAENAIIESERNYREIFNNSSDAIAIVHPDTGEVEDVNDTLLSMFETTYNHVLTNNLNRYSAGDSEYNEKNARKLLKAAQIKGSENFEWLARTDRGKFFWIDVNMKLVIINGESKILTIIRNIDEKKNAEDKIKYQHDFEKLILTISSRFVNIPFNQVDQNIKKAFKEICYFIKSDAGYMFLYNTNENTINLSHYWHNDSLNIIPEDLIKMPYQLSQWHTRQILANKVIQIENLKKLPPEASQIKSLLIKQNINSIINVPLLFENASIGFMGLAVNTPGRKWLAEEISLLKITGQIFVNAIKRKKAAEILRESEEKYRLLIEGQTDLIVKLDANGHFLFVSPSYCEIFKKRDDELLGNPFISLVHEDDQEITLKSFKSLSHPPYTCYLEQRAFTKSGWRWLAWSYKAILNNSNKLLEIIGIGRDITYQKDVEEALRRSEARFRSIVQQLSDIVIILDAEYQIVYDTPSIKNVLEYDEGSLVGKDIFSIFLPEDKNFIINKINQIIKKKDSTITIEARVKKSTGKIIPAELVFINLLHLISIKGIVLTLRDISERKLLDKKILDAVIKTEEQERERFAKNLHDDLGPLLSSIKMYLGLLKTSNPPEKQDYVITQLNEVVKEAITTTKEVSNDLSPHILINYGLASAIENFIQKIPVNIKVNFICTLPSERYSNIIENSFYRIIKELINNSIKHSKSSKIDITLEEKGQNLYLSYTDNGKGFDLEKYEKSRKTGMGISNIISRAKSLNGVYELKTNINSGFLFRITIPMHQSFK